MTCNPGYWRETRSWRRRVRNTLAAGGAVLLVLFLAGGASRGGRGYFSPDTLECRTHSEWLLPLVSVEVPLYRGPSSTHRWPIVDYLVAQGLWSKSDATDPRWLPTFHWNQRWSDGESQFHRELGWNGDSWIGWSKAHPDMAAALWPKVLATLREPGVTDVDHAAMLMRAAQQADGVVEFEMLAAELAATRKSK